MSNAEIILRALELDDIPKLIEIRPTYITDTILAVERTGLGLTTDWRLVERKLSIPFDKGNLYNFGDAEQKLVRQRLRRPEETYQTIAELDGRLIGLVEVELQEWNDTAWLANLMIDLDYRGQGLGRRLWH